MPRFRTNGSGNIVLRHGTTASVGVTVTANASANTKGSYTEIVASTSYEYNGLILYISDTNATTDDKLIDIAIGAAGSEKDIIKNYLVTCDDQTFEGIPFDIKVPVGSRISVRCQSTTGSSTAFIGVQGVVRNDFSGSTYVDSLGQNTADSGGVSVDPGGTLNTKGSWAEITASSSYKYIGFYVAIGKRANSVDTNMRITVDIGVGAGGSEKVIAADLQAFSTTQEVSSITHGPFYIAIPAGSRIAARAQANSIDATDRLIDIVIYPIIGSCSYDGAGNMAFRHGSNAASGGLTLTSNASANTKGAYGQLVASTSYEYNQIIVQTNYVGATTVDILIDIAIGDAGSEKVIVPNLQFTGDDSTFVTHILNIKIPVGSRISARIAATTGSSQVFLSVEGVVRNDLEGSQMVLTYGANTADSGGTSVDPGGSANTKGSWVELAATTDYDANSFLVAFGKQANSADTTAGFLFDIGIGAGGSEKVIAADIGAKASTTEISAFTSGEFPAGIPKGSRIAARAQCSITDATDRLCDISLSALH